MNECEQASRLGAYQDGELSPTARAELERHLDHCPQCAAELGRIRKLAALLGSMPASQMPPLSLHRLHRAIDSLRSGGVVRLAEWMAAAAAVILLGCVLSLARQGSGQESAGAMPVWEVEAVAQQPAESGSEESLVGWMVADLSGKDEHD